MYDCDCELDESSRVGGGETMPPVLVHEAVEKFWPGFICLFHFKLLIPYAGMYTSLYCCDPRRSHGEVEHGRELDGNHPHAVQIYSSQWPGTLPMSSELLVFPDT
jgi:hypothetical protein